MALTIQLTVILSVVLVVGVYWGPWVGLTRSLPDLPVEVFLAVVRRLDTNLAPLMTVLVPVSLAGQIVLVVVSAQQGSVPLTLSAIALALFGVTVVVTMVTEVPIVKQIVGWTPESMPQGWEAKRDRWMRFHLARVLPGLASLLLYIAAAIVR